VGVPQKPTSRGSGPRQATRKKKNGVIKWPQWKGGKLQLRRKLKKKITKVEEKIKIANTTCLAPLPQKFPLERKKGHGGGEKRRERT